MGSCQWAASAYASYAPPKRRGPLDGLAQREELYGREMTYDVAELDKVALVLDPFNFDTSLLVPKRHSGLGMEGAIPSYVSKLSG